MAYDRIRVKSSTVRKRRGAKLEIVQKHSKIPPSLIDAIKQGDNISILSKIPNNSIDLVITSPPYYQQRDYGKGGRVDEYGTVDNYLKTLLNVFEECVRITKPCGSIVFNIGDKYVKGNLMLVPYHFALRAINEHDVKLVNNITWLKTNPAPRQFKRRLVSSTEPFFHFVKTNDYYYNINEFHAQCNRITKPKNRSAPGKRYAEMIKKSKLTHNEKN